jgi:hypothetical protein
MASKGNPKKDSNAEDMGAVIGRKAGRLLKTGGPRVKKFVEGNRPKAEQAGRDVMRYAQEHEDELRSLAMKGVRMRLGVVGTALDALNKPSSGGPTQVKRGACRACQTVNPVSAKFCNECGARLESLP